MKVLGVRSFDNKSAQYIRFEAPLTLIVGYNGSGKTTIIECLKYASMGALPPNSKTGGTFVHDPKLCAEKEVLAQVKLQFRNATGNKMVVTRSLQVTIKKTGPSQKAIDNQLLMETNGERHAISSKVAELDKIVPEYLGVSPAILESVIFCHQDDSLWPMSEPSVLKKKFDNIFEAQQYTKAVDNLKALRKVKVDQGKLFKQEEEHARHNKSQAEKVGKKMETLYDEIEDFRSQADNLKKEMEAAAIVREEKRAEANKAENLVDRLSAKNDQLRYLKSSLDDLRTRMKELAESDEWLQTTLNDYEKRLSQYETQRNKSIQDYTKLQTKIEDSRNVQAAKRTEQGRHQAAKDAYDGHVKERVALVQQAARTHNMRGFEGELQMDQIQDFVNRIRKQLQEKERELDRVKKASEDEQSKAQEAINDLSTRKTTAVQSKVNAKQIVDANEKRVKLKQRESDQIKMDEGTMASLMASLSDVQEQYRHLESEFEAAEWESKISKEETHLRELDAEASRLREEQFQSTKLAKDRAQLEYTKQKAKEEQTNLDIMTSTNCDQLKKLIGSDWDVKTLDDDYRGVLDIKSQALTEAKKQQQSLAEELSELNLKLRSHRVNLKKKQDEQRQCQAAVLASIVDADGNPITSVDQYEPNLEELKNEYEDFKQKVDGQVYITEYYEKTCRNSILKKDMCSLCTRPFKNPGERTTALEKINYEIKKYADQVIKGQLQESIEAMKQANAVRGQYEMYNALTTTEIPYLENEIKAIENARTPLTKRLEQQDIEVSEVDASRRDAESLRRNVDKMILHATQLSKHENDIATLSSQAVLSGGTRSVDEIQEQSEICQRSITTQKFKLKKLQSDEKNARAELANVERRVGQVSRESQAAKFSMDNKQSCLTAIAEFRANTSLQYEVIQKADAELEGLGPDVLKAEAQHENAKQRGRVKEKEVLAEKDKLTETVSRFQLVEKHINNYIESGGDSKLEACQKAIERLVEGIEVMNSDLADIAAQSNDLQKRIDDSGSTKQSIADNLSYRKNLRTFEKLQQEIAQLNANNVTGNYARFNAEANAANDRYEQATSKRGVIISNMGILDREYKSAQDVWELDFKDAASKYRESHVLVATNQAACDDLAKFQKALDQAIMQYHTNKMAEINAVANELWQSTYQGTDVDTIMIRSENEVESSSKRNYNYRVVMVKQDAEMDMRGRCSAGQRVLACIVIRLALAECFGINCGVIALDEPTTNLDADNIKALAVSLNQIIQHRKQQKNFQIIIITHDEEFLKHMHCSAFTDKYWRISRDEKQKSQIDQSPISDIM